MRPAANDLDRFERMAQRSKERREKAGAEEQLQQTVDEAEQVRRELRDVAQHFLAGPPDGCRHCYTWHWTPWHGWAWQHCGGHWVKVRPWPEADNEPTACCMHYCHGPEGHWLPVVAYA
jgi:hypothetical protein